MGHNEYDSSMKGGGGEVRYLANPAFCPPTMTVPLALTVTLVNPADARIDAVVTAVQGGGWIML